MVVQKKKKKIKYYRLIFFLVIFWFLGNSIYNFVLNLMVQTELVEQGVIEKKFATEAYVLRDEIVITAPATGRVNLLVEPGQKVHKDMPILEIHTSGGTSLQAGRPIVVQAPVSGVLSCIIDGGEELFNPREFANLDSEKIQSIKIKAIDNTQKDMVEKGSRYCKIINNLANVQLYLEFPLNLFTEPIKKGQLLELVFTRLDKRLSAPIIDLKGIGNTAQVLVNVPETWYSLFNVRIEPVEIILEKGNGILIPKKALVEKENGEIGVYWVRKGFVFWQEVDIISENNDRFLVNGLEPYTEIILNPSLVKEGQHLY